MPGFDGNGPVGLGARTGRAMGRCAGSSPAPGGFWGCGLRRGFRGIGRGFSGRGLFRSMEPALDATRDQAFDETSMLKDRLERLEEEIAQVKSRLQSMKS